MCFKKVIKRDPYFLDIPAKLSKIGLQRGVFYKLTLEDDSVLWLDNSGNEIEKDLIEKQNLG